MSLTLRIPSRAGVQYRLRGALYYANYLAGAYREKVWLVGDGRSGTTWLANLINYQARYRFCFEPFHPKEERLPQALGPFPYIRPGSRPAELESHLRAVFSGQYQSWWSDQYHQGYRFEGLLVKCIFAHLFLGWADEILPEVRKVLLLRHPCAVAASKKALSNSYWANEPAQFWEQAELREDYLRPYEKLIRTTTDPFLKSVVSWAIVNTVPLRQLGEGRFHIVYYERLCEEPEQELGRLFQYLDYPVADPWKEQRLRSLYNAPSQTSRASNGGVSPEERVYGWTRNVERDTIARAVEILSEFGLDHLYGEDPRPKLQHSHGIACGRLGSQPPLENLGEPGAILGQVEVAKHRFPRRDSQPLA